MSTVLSFTRLEDDLDALSTALGKKEGRLKDERRDFGRDGVEVMLGRGADKLGEGGSGNDGSASDAVVVEPRMVGLGEDRLVNGLRTGHGQSHAQEWMVGRLCALGVTRRSVDPESLSLPWVGWELNASPAISEDAGPVDGAAVGVVGGQGLESGLRFAGVVGAQGGEQYRLLRLWLAEGARDESQECG
jgi:hypothetical protein